MGPSPKDAVFNLPECPPDSLLSFLLLLFHLVLLGPLLVVLLHLAEHLSEPGLLTPDPAPVPVRQPAPEHRLRVVGHVSLDRGQVTHHIAKKEINNLLLH